MFSTKQLLVPATLLLFLLFSNYSATGQTCTPVFHKTFHGSGEDEALDVGVASDKGSIVAGRTTTGSSDWNGFLLRLNEQGDIVWATSYGGSGYDELTKVKQTNDGGFIALGRTRSFGANAGEVWLIKTDPSGNLLWSKQYSQNGEPAIPKCIIQLSDGGFAFAFNTNDSTSLGNGIIIRTDVSGNIMWSKIFDNGKDDGINSIYQDGNSLLAGGYATVIDREGILMRLSLDDGTVRWAKWFARRAGLNDEIIHVEKTPEGLAFGASSTWVRTIANSSDYYLTVFKTLGDDSIYVQRRIRPNTQSGYTIQSVQLRAASDGGFTYLINDTTLSGGSTFQKLSPAGLPDWGRVNNMGYGQKRLSGFDLFEDKGYVIAGHYKDFLSSNRSRIQVLKTDVTGKNGSCSGIIAANFTDTTFYSSGNFIWHATSSGIIEHDIIPIAAPLNYTSTVLCTTNYCTEPYSQPALSCYATLLSHIKNGGNYSFTPVDVEKVNDGYIIIGYNRLFWNVEPMMIKVQGDGTIIWAKSLTEWIHSGGFEQVLTTADGNLLIKGHFDVTVNHGGWSGAILLKVTPHGEVLWSKKMDGDIYDLKMLPNGGFAGTMTRNYGFPPIYISLFMMDPHGNITWQKQMNVDYNHSPIYRTFQYDGNHFYVAGEFYNQHPQNIAFEKIDTAGNHIWTKVFRVEGFSTSAASLEIIGDTLHLMAFYYDNSIYTFRAQKRLALIKIATNGEGMSILKFNDLDLIADGRTYAYRIPWKENITKTHDNHFVIADLVSNISDSSLVLTKFTSSGEIIWSRRYPQLRNHNVSRIKDDNGSLLILGRRFTGESDYTYQFETLLMRTDKNGFITEQGTSSCTTVPHQLQANKADWELNTWYRPPPTAPGTIKSASINLIERFFPLKAYESCAKIGDCSTIQIIGQKLVCSNSDTLVYKVRRNPGCNISPSWKYNPLAVSVVSETDSSIAVVFKTTGAVSLMATISSGCGVISDSIIVSIPSAMLPADLGSDTTICIGTSIILNPGTGFISYAWQDGSTNPTYTVTEPGSYHVSTTGSCGVFSDTIVVSLHSTAAFSAGDDRIKCNQDTIHLGATPGFTNYIWSPDYKLNPKNAQEVVTHTDKDIAYFVQAEEIPGCYVYDTVMVKVYHSPPIFLGNDTSFCLGETIMLNAGGGFSSYEWSGGQMSQQIEVNASGVYRVSATTAEGCVSRDSMQVISVWQLPQLSLDKRTDLCLGDQRILNPGNFTSYLWQDGTTNALFAATDTGLYYVRVVDFHNCVNSDTVHITTINPLPAGFLPGDTSICSYNTLQLLPMRQYSSYHWSNGSTGNGITIDKHGFYWLEVTDQKGCRGKDSITVKPKDCMNGIYIPTAFSPNGDGKNDMFRAQAFGKLLSFNLQLFNRWGQQVFKTDDVSRGWDGKISSLSQQVEVFVWICTYQLEGEQQKIEKGTVTLIR